MKKKVKVMVLAVLVIVCAAAYGAVLFMPKSVEAETVKRSNLERVVTAEGTLLPVNSMTINAKESGNVSELLCRQGTFVKKGEPLLKRMRIPHSA